MIARRVYAVIRAASLVAALALSAVLSPYAVRALRPDDLVFIGGALVVTLLLAWMRAPAAHFERSVRPTPESDRVGLLTPLLLVVLVREGWFWAAWCAMAAQLVRPPGPRRHPFPDRLATAALRFPALFAGVLVMGPLRAAAWPAPSLVGFAVFTVLGAAYVLAIDLLWLDPLTALRQTRSLARIWKRHSADLVTVLTVLAEAAWAYVVAHVARAEGAALGVALLIPLAVVGAVHLRLARVNARLHRLSLSREAVDAMLRASDPQPQLRSLLESIDPRIVRESVEIAAFGRGGTDRWSRLMRFGAALPGDLERLGGRALLEVQVTGEHAHLESDLHGSVHAYAARDAEGGLRGALVVFRPFEGPALVAARDFERAAVEIGPLLGEYGAIAATRSAASLDTLTGLPNRRGVTRALDEAMAHVRGGGRYAVLLLDVDHFKSINDLLGHPTGDRALSRIGHLIGENIRGVDVAGRFGGEEFLVLLRDASRERALQVAERLRLAIETGGLAYADGKPVTVSVGVAYARAADLTGDVVERADRALYRAKNAGRNQVVESPLIAV
ncbi:MAG TPA: GGDEF domain-containing protein [Candidatus Elarobacter sp.]|jgi:diguanylate cyclase (GGDEF)-like protein|nr:GGDEF domain-containing protein [Candidatus Elarobacter sp.]